MPEQFVVPESEEEQVRELQRLLSYGSAALIGPTGERLDLPETIYHVLKHAVNAMQHGRAISLVPEKQDVTTQMGADILGVSRPHFVKLLESRQLPFHKVGSHRRVYLRDVQEFMKRRDSERRIVLAQLAKDTYEAGYYDKAAIPDGGSDE